MSSNLTALMIIIYLVQGALMAALGAVAILGWKRHRQVGYLILVAYAVVVLFAFVGRTMWFPIVQRFAASLFGNLGSSTELFVISNAFSGFLTSSLLVAAIALLVFSKPPPTPPTN